MDQLRHVPKPLTRTVPSPTTHTVRFAFLKKPILSGSYQPYFPSTPNQPHNFSREDTVRGERRQQGPFQVRGCLTCVTVGHAHERRAAL